MNKAILGAILMAAVITPAIAQDDDGGDITRVFFIDVKTGHGDEFEAGWGPYWSCYAENGGTWNWTAWRPATGELGGVVFRSGGHTWADFDTTNPGGEACDEVFDTFISPHVAKFYGGFQRTTSYARQDENKEVNVVMAIDFDFKDDRVAVEVIEAFHEAAMANNWGNYVWINHVTSSDGWDMTVAILNENFADVAPDGDPFWVRQAAYHGEEEAEKMRQKWIENVNRVSTRLWSKDEGISYTTDSE